MRHAQTIVLTLLPFLLLACGDGAGVPRIEISTFDVDPAPPSDLWFVPLDPSKERTPLHALGNGVYEAPGAAPGGFQVEGPGGWSTLNAGPQPPELIVGVLPPKVRIAPAHTLYVFCKDLEHQPGRRWGAQAVDADGTHRRLDIEALLVSNRRVVALRFRPEDWKGQVEVLGHLVGGGADRIRPEDVGKGPVTEVIAFEAPADGHALLATAKPAGVTPVQVGLVPASPDLEVDALPVEIRLEDVPLPLSWTRKSRDGIVRLTRLPLLVRDVWVGIGDTSFVMTLADVRDQETLYLLVVPQEGRREVPVVWPDGRRPGTILARPASAAAYGLVPTAGDAVVLPAEATTLLAERDGRWSRVEVPAKTTDEVVAPPYEPGVVVQGNVEGLPPSGFAAVRLFRREGEARFTGTTFTLRLAPNGSFSFRVPVGIYEAEVATAKGVWHRKRPIEATEAGGQHHITLRAP